MSSLYGLRLTFSNFSKSMPDCLTSFFLDLSRCLLAWIFLIAWFWFVTSCFEVVNFLFLGGNVFVFMLVSS